MKLAVVEAKALAEELTEGVAQAKNYAGKLEIRFTYATNGQGIYGIDMETGAEGEAARYPTPEELDQAKLTPLLRLKYHSSINDAVADLGNDIGQAFAGFQRHLYQDVA